MINSGKKKGKPFGTIQKGLDSALPGDTVNVIGRACGANPIGYTDDGTQSNHETFPLKIPNGVTVKGVLGPEGSPVYVWTTTTIGTPPVLFQFDDVHGNNIGSALKKMFLIAGSHGINVEATNGGIVSPTIGTITFSHNIQGIQVFSKENGEAFPIIQNCTITDALPIFLPGTCSLPAGPGLQTMQFGIRLRAIEPSMAGNPGSIDATIDNLSVNGVFSRSSSTDYQNLIYLTSRGRVHFQHGQPFDDISRIDVTVNGGVLNGKAASNPETGWLRGIKAEVETPSPGNALHQYAARFLVTLNGTQIKNFREQGILGQNEDDSRGQFVLNGATKVSGTGNQLTGRGQLLTGIGIYILSSEGYMSLKGNDAEVSGNHNDGIYIQVLASDASSSMKWPVGGWIGLDSCSIHNNLGNGVHLSGLSGITGGTWHYLDEGKKVITLDPSSLGLFPDPTLEFGQGFLNACDISNNGSGIGPDGADSGILIKLFGTGTGVSGTVGALRIVNDIIWNNFSSGVLFVNDAPSDMSPILVAPIIQCTIAGNNVTDFSVEPGDGMGSSQFKYQWIVTTQTDIENLWTRIYDSIFEMQDSSLEDFNPEADFLLEPDPVPSGSIPTVIYGDALRITLNDLQDSFYFGGQQVGLNSLNKHSKTPFLGEANNGSINWSSTDPTQLFLVSGANIGDFQDKTRTDLGPLFEELADFDFTGILRPPVMCGTRDKGAEEL